MNKKLEILIDDLKRTNYFIKQLNETYKNLDRKIFNEGQVTINIDKKCEFPLSPMLKNEKISTTLSFDVDLLEQYIISELEENKKKYDNILTEINKVSHKNMEEWVYKGYGVINDF